MSTKPTRIMVRGEPYIACVALVNTERDGAPSNLTLLPPDHAIELAGGEKFVILYIPKKVLPDSWKETP